MASKLLNITSAAAAFAAPFALAAALQPAVPRPASCRAPSHTGDKSEALKGAIGLFGTKPLGTDPNGAVSISGPSVAAYTFAGVPQHNGIIQNYKTTSATSNAAYFADILSSGGGDGASSTLTNYNAVIVGRVATAGAGVSGVAGNLVCDLQSTVVFSGNTGCTALELDLNTGNVDHPGRLYGNANRTMGLLINNGGTKMNSMAIAVGGGTGKFSSWDYGLLFDQAVAQPAIRTATLMDYTYSFTHDQDVGVHQYGAEYKGVYKSAAISIKPIGTPPPGSNALVFPNGSIDMTGVIVGQRIRSNGPVTVRGSLNVAQTTPASSKAPCTAGDRAADANYTYECYAANSWARTALKKTAF